MIYFGILLLCTTTTLFVHQNEAIVHHQHHHKYCIVGAGPAGLQMASELEKNGLDYLVLERNSQPGSFFNKFPRHNTLISINKRHTSNLNTDFNLRHDWNSLLSDRNDLLFRHYSRLLFPHRLELVRYLTDFQHKLRLRVMFNTTVISVRRVMKHLFILSTQEGDEWTCQVLLLATGLSLPNEVDIGSYSDKILHYHNMSLDLHQFTNKRVLIVGKGNSAFETAAAMRDETAFTHLVSRHRLRIAWSTHYVGDLRAVNNELLDLYQLKSLDALLDADVKDLKLKYRVNEKVFTFVDDTESSLESDKKRRSFYDMVILCLGRKFDLSPFHDIGLALGNTLKYPKIKANYESLDQANVFIIGTASHSLDWRKSSGGFIHGFRYTVRSLANYLQVRYENSIWPSISGSLVDLTLVNRMIKRINEASSLYQMFAFLSDVIIVDRAKSSFLYLEDYPLKTIDQLSKFSGHEVIVHGQSNVDVFVLALEYGKNFSGAGKDVFREDRTTAEEWAAWKCNFLHPVLYYFNRLPSKDEMMTSLIQNYTLPKPAALLHLVEDLHTNFRSRASYVIPLTAFLEVQLQVNRSMEPVTHDTKALHNLIYDNAVASAESNAMLLEWPFMETRSSIPILKDFSIAFF